jgi:hypothetical protein
MDAHFNLKRDSDFAKEILCKVRRNSVRPDGCYAGREDSSEHQTWTHRIPSFIAMHGQH